MIAWIIKILFHKHKWKTINEIDWFNSNKSLIARVYVQYCEECGDYRTQKVRFNTFNMTDDTR